jgi:hypothetical protein
MRTTPCLLPALLLLVTPAVAQVWQNETDSLTEAHFASLYLPASFSVGLGLTVSDSIYGRIYHSGLTESGSPSASILAQVGWGPDGSDPRLTPWTWTNAAFSNHIGNDDEYEATFVTPLNAGTYGYTYRFSIDGGSTWTLADKNGAGSNFGLLLETNQFGSLTVLADGTPPIPEPSTYAALAGLVTLAAAGWRRRQARLVAAKG